MPVLGQGNAITYGTGCPVPEPIAVGFAPNPGAGTLQLFETGIPAGVLPIACLGTSSTQWGALSLPFPLDGLGLLGCSVVAEPLSLHSTILPANGVAEHTLPVPGSAALTGAQVFAQWLNAGDPAISTTLPLTFSNGVAFTLGTQVGMPGFTLTGDPTAPTGATWTYAATTGGVAYDLSGRLYKPTTPPAGGHLLYPAVILNHGNGGNANGYSAGIAATMRTWGLVCIMTNLTHAGGVPLGAPGLATERGASAANVLRNRKCIDLLQSLGYVDMRRLAAHGHSMGAFATGALLGTHPQWFLAGSHTAGGMSTQPGAAATTLAQAQGITTPYQLHHGDADTTVPLAMDQALANQLAANPTVHQLLVYPGYTHSQISNDAGMLSTVRAWYQQHGLLP
ncbi:MAG: prolyl oligopeptidase family serine peptidase [Planctomycetota bacterium]